MSQYEHVSDGQLVEKIRDGSPELFSYLVERYEKKLLRYARSIVHRDDIGQDIVQDSFIKAYKNLHGFDRKQSFSTWIYRIVHNEAINTIKKYKREIPLIAEMELPSVEHIENDFETKERIAQATWCLSKMPVIYSEPLALFGIEDLSYEEISDILRLPMGTVATRINRAKAMMKALCQKHNIS